MLPLITSAIEPVPRQGSRAPKLEGDMSEIRGCLAGFCIFFATAAANAQEIMSAADFDQAAVEHDLERRVSQHEQGLAAARQAQQQQGARRAASGASASGSLGSELEPKIVNGTLTARFPTAGALVKLNAAGKLTSWCSGTLLGCGTFLTAHHCVEDDSNPAHYRVFLQHGGIFEAAKIVKHQPYSFPDGDVAVVRLSRPVAGITPTRLQETAAGLGTRGIIVGFGRSGGAHQDYGLKRVGQVKTASCKSPYSNDTLLCWNYDAPVGTPGENSNTCNADSGGPLYFEAGTGAVVGGVTSGGRKTSCLTGDHAYDAKVTKYRSWIVEQAENDIGQNACGAMPQVGAQGTRVHAGAKELSEEKESTSFEFPLKSSARIVRVALNATDDSVARFGYFVRLNGAASPTQHDCHPDSGQYGFCEFPASGAGSVHVLAKRQDGSGWVQVVVTEID
jgi:hypothetical protein